MPIGPRDSRQEDSLTTLFRLGDSLTDGEGDVERGDIKTEM